MIQAFKTNIPLDFLESLRLAMNYNFISKSDIFNWAISSIKTNDNFDPILLDITTGNNIDAREIDYAIKQITEGKLETKNSKRILISYISRELLQDKITHKEAAAFLYKLYFDLDFEDSEKNRFYSFDYDIIFNEFNAPEKLGQTYIDLENTIAPYLDLNFENYDEWTEINSKINLLKASY
jgi:hypothetical protein